MYLYFCSKVFSCNVHKQIYVKPHNAPLDVYNFDTFNQLEFIVIKYTKYQYFNIKT